MKLNFYSFILLIFSFCLINFSLLAKETTEAYKYNNYFDSFEWEFLSNKDGIVTYSYKIEGTNILAFKAKAHINAPIESICAVLRDVKVAKEWDSSLIEKRTLVEVSDLEAITYSINSLPWPASNRDMILHNKLYLDRKNKYFVVHMKSIDHKDYPEDQSAGERAKLSFGVVYLRPISPRKMYIELMIHIDPQGLLPSWIVNSVQKKWPINFINSLEKQSLRPNPPLIRPQIKVLLDQFIEILKKEGSYKEKVISEKSSVSKKK